MFRAARPAHDPALPRRLLVDRGHARCGSTKQSKTARLQGAARLRVSAPSSAPSSHSRDGRSVRLRGEPVRRSELAPGRRNLDHGEAPGDGRRELDRVAHLERREVVVVRPDRRKRGFVGGQRVALIKKERLRLKLLLPHTRWPHLPRHRPTLELACRTLAARIVRALTWLVIGLRSGRPDVFSVARFGPARRGRAVVPVGCANRMRPLESARLQRKSSLCTPQGSPPISAPARVASLSLAWAGSPAGS
jgi:hypothetical protein